ncbi:hypothetical protein EYF80_058048 [Liparis tanakae]|uniref:Uncharacterized protein n=1 Tax=Liparis tanakae TaxID=230148 RepID=A0A4Z2ESN6_9TELE|nr:hypothetical protein EYF80_058048 [Liparis tanakae]
MKFVFGGRARGAAGEGNTAEPAGGSSPCRLEADEGGVDLAHAGQRQHDLPPVLRVLLKGVPFEHLQSFNLPDTTMNKINILERKPTAFVDITSMM